MVDERRHPPGLTNPKPNQTDYFGTGPLVHFGIGFLNKIPVMELIIGMVLLVGAIYFFAVQKKKPFTPVVPPDEDAPLPAPPESEGFKV